MRENDPCEDFAAKLFQVPVEGLQPTMRESARYLYHKTQESQKPLPRKDTHNQRGDPPGTGWFHIAGVQDGWRPFWTQIERLQILLAETRAHGYSVLDLGCAEGLVALEFATCGASLVKGVELLQSRVDTAIRIAEEWGLVNAYFEAGNLEQLDLKETASWDITLLLAILHKLREPEEFLRKIAAKTNHYLAIKLPDPTIKDPRSGNREIDPKAVLGEEFETVFEGRNSIREWLLISHRKRT